MSESSTGGEPLGMPPQKRFYGVGYVAVFVGIAVMITLVWTQMQQAKRRGSQPLPTLGVMPEFALQTPGGATVRNSDLRGRTWVGYFFTPGAGVPQEMMENRMRDLQSRLQQVGDDVVRIVGFAWTREGAGEANPPALPAGADAGRWLFLVAPGEEIRRMPPQVFGGEEFAGEQTADFPLRFWVVDGAGNIRSVRDSTNPEAPANLLMDIGALVREAKSPPPEVAPQSL